MPEPLDDEEVQNILDAWEAAEDPKYSVVAQEVGHSKDTVKKYVTKHFDGEGSVDEDVGTPPGMESDDEESGSLFTEPGEDLARDFKNFMLKINDDSGIGIKKKAIRIMASEVQTNQALPSPDSIVSFLEAADSGVKNAQELYWIGRQYGHWKDRYEQTRMMQSGGMYGQEGFQSPFERSGAGPMAQGQAGGMGLGGPQGAQGGQPPGGMGAANPMMMMFQQMQQQMQQLQQEVSDGRGKEDDDVLERKTQEFLERKIEQLIDSEDGKEQQAIVQELQHLRQQIQQGGAARSPSMGDDWRQSVVDLARQGDLSVSEAKDLLEEFGEAESNPEVLEKKHEKEIREMELKHETERYERVGGLLENLTDRFGQAFGEAIVSGGSDAPSLGQGTDAGASEAATTGGDVAPSEGEAVAHAENGAGDVDEFTVTEQEAEECEHCGENLIQGPNFVSCPSCEFSIQPCDRCGSPVTVPPIGGEDYGRCGDCEEILELPEDHGESVECEGCGWEGTRDETMGHFIRCDSCDTHRPIVRKEQLEQQRSGVAEMMGD